MRLFEAVRPRKFYHVTLSENVSSIMKKGLIPIQGERSAKLDDYGIFMFGDKSHMEDALVNWLGDEFDEDDELTVLIINLPDNWPLVNEDTAGFEWISRDPIPSKYIQVGWTE